MLKKILWMILISVVLSGSNPVFSATVEENWQDFLHYTKIGRFDLAKGYGEALIESEPDPVKLLELSEKSPSGYRLLHRAADNADDKALKQICNDVLDIIEEGRFQKRTDPEIILQEIDRLYTTDRGRLNAVERLQNAGEYAVRYMLEALQKQEDQQKKSHLIWALPQIGRDAVRPLAAALQVDDTGIKAEIIKALGEIGYPQGLAYLKYIVENSDSSELVRLAEESMKKIDPAAVNVDAAGLFYMLGENYYYHTDSLKPKQDADFANIWFWDEQKQQLYREKVDRSYFYELMSMRSCEWALKADPEFGKAIGLWIAGFFKAESNNIPMPDYFGENHPNAYVYATTAGPEYLNQALARAIKDENSYVALSSVQALADVAGEQTLFTEVGPGESLTNALSYKDKTVRYSAAIAIARVSPSSSFAESERVVKNLGQAIVENLDAQDDPNGLWSKDLSAEYAEKAIRGMLNLGQTRNEVIDLSIAEKQLTRVAEYGKTDQMRILANKVLSYINTDSAQRLIAQIALNEENPANVRIEAFNSLSDSAKLNGNKLDSETVDKMYNLIASRSTDSQLRSAASGAFGALNLPSRQVKNLILDQAKT